MRTRIYARTALYALAAGTAFAEAVMFAQWYTDELRKLVRPAPTPVDTASDGFSRIVDDIRNAGNAPNDWPSFRDTARARGLDDRAVPGLVAHLGTFHRFEPVVGENWTSNRCVLCAQGPDHLVHTGDPNS